MLKRRLPAEPFVPTAVWSWRAAAFAATLGIIAVLLGHVGTVEPSAVLAVLAASLLGAVGALGLAFCAAVAVWRTGYRGTARALGGIALALVVLAYPGFLAVEAYRLPALTDVTTDLANPPGFSTSAAAKAARGGATHDEMPTRFRDVQRQAYPALAPVMLDLDAGEAYALVLKVVATRQWRVIEAVAPKGRFGVGHVDAVARSRIMGFPADVTIRLRPSSGQTRVDLRSASRFGPHDFGSNAARIAAFADDLENAE